MRTTVAIDKDIAIRVMSHADKLGNRSMASMVEYMLRKTCDFVDKNGYDALVKIPSAKK
jgi:hypothetical protein